MSFPDTNHNTKNLHYQDFNSSGDVTAVTGNFVVDTMLLKMAKVVRKLFHVDDFASGAVVPQLSSHKTVKALLDIDTADIGNKMVS